MGQLSPGDPVAPQRSEEELSHQRGAVEEFGCEEEGHGESDAAGASQVPDDLRSVERNFLPSLRLVRQIL